MLVYGNHPLKKQILSLNVTCFWRYLSQMGVVSLGVMSRELKRNRLYFLFRHDWVIERKWVLYATHRLQLMNIPTKYFQNLLNDKNLCGKVHFSWHLNLYKDNQYGESLRITIDIHINQHLISKEMFLPKYAPGPSTVSKNVVLPKKGNHPY